MPLRQRLSPRTRLHSVRSRYPSTWSILCGKLQHLDSWRVLVSEYVDSDGTPLSADDAVGITNATEALQLWERSCTLDELLRALTNHELTDTVAFLHRNLYNEPSPSPSPLPLPLPSPSPSPTDHTSDPHVFPIEQLISAITQGRRIGTGGFADVFHVTLGGRNLAVKDYAPGLAENIRQAVVKSIGTLTRLRHDCIVRLVGYSSICEGRMFTVFEHYPNGDLRRLLESFECGSWPAPSRFDLASVRLRIALDVVSAIEFLHAATEQSQAAGGDFAAFHFVHKDVKPSNLLLTADWRCHLADLDFLDLATSGVGHTLIDGYRLAPVERVHTLGYNPDDPVVTCKWDVFSAGVTLLELFTGLRGCPTSGQPREAWLCSALADGREAPPAQRGLLVDAACYERLCETAIAPCLASDYRQRCTAADLRRRLTALQDSGPDPAQESDLLLVNWAQLESAIALAGPPIGSGGFGRVYRVELHGRPVAVKRLATGAAASAHVALHRQARLRHPHLLQLLGFAASPDTAELCLVYELCDRGCLRHLIDAFGRGEADPGSEFQLAGVRIRMAHELASVLRYLHSQPEVAEAASGAYQRFFLVHQDVKSANVMLTASWRCKLGDLDSLQVATPGTGDTRIGDRPLVHPLGRYSTRGYHMPGELWSCKIDVYALGVTFLELFTGREAAPTSAGDAGELRHCLDGVNWEAARFDASLLPAPQPGLQISAACYRDLCASVFRACLVKDTALRPDSAQVLREMERLYSCCR